MKRKILTAAVFFISFYFSLTVIIFACGFMGTNYLKNSEKKENMEEKVSDETKTVAVLIENQVKKIALNDYLYGVVAAEMPAIFETEALKAQAVAARTETVKKMGNENKTHPNADICDNASHCQAYYPKEKLEEIYGKNWIETYYNKIKSAVDLTDGVIITYNGEPITAVFHSSSSGMTENSKDVWGGDYPYLVSVKSEGEAESSHYMEEKSFSFDEFKMNISKIKNVDFSDNPQNWFSDIKRNESGSVNTIDICGVTFKGTEIRSSLFLRSTNFEISVNDKITFLTKGNGHGVGMSQYGANHMAKKGYTYEEILKKYYTGTSVKSE